ncbi:Uncharacterised protein [Moraxella caprae]|uniref:H repeat-associated protein N-terminal domain-containing protein n=1 Tax=Moraxella caprae TaxID=90240 RepID=A0A378U4S1_9GAMM|nr:transposase family protein [Moraxella caprae]STZ09681.1 Uncharacterised protein [Moraxella caprae]STZ70258.1 Uncharacterised protein [Moraxella caprae]
MLTNPIDYLSQVHDPRRQNKNLLHPLKNILTIALTAVTPPNHKITTHPHVPKQLI